MNKNKMNAIDSAKHNFTHMNAMQHIGKSTMFLPAHIQTRIAELERELLVTKFRLGETDQVLDAIPACVPCMVKTVCLMRLIGSGKRSTKR
jgi:hypothetical protein